jgi:peptidoglycan/xylan/chitin deacetylase (PgdA/CDA1 family)
LKDIPRVFPVLMYHQCPDDFESHLDYLNRSGYRLVHLADVADYLVNPEEKEFPEKQAVLTFDDGYRDFYDRAARLLEANGFKSRASICISTDYVSQDAKNRKMWGDVPAMTWDELRRLKGDGYEIVSHSVTHANLEEIKDDAERLRYEIGGSKRALINHHELGIENVPFFCFPYGAGWKTKEARDQRINNVLRQAGYIGALRAEYHTGELWDQYCIPRCGVSTLDDLKALMGKEFSCQP